jgi:hypothetical protein
LGSSGSGYNAGAGAGRSPAKEALKSIGAVATRGELKTKCAILISINDVGKRVWRGGEEPCMGGKKR